MRIVLDANCLISSVLSGSGAPAAILDHWRDGDIELVVCPKLLGEIDKSLRTAGIQKRFSLDEIDIAEFINLLRSNAEVFADPDNLSRICTDPNDDYLFALASNSQCDYLITYDKAVRVTETSLPVLSPGAFLTIIDRLR